MTAFRRLMTLGYQSLTPVEKAELKGIALKFLMAIVTATGLLTYFVVVPAISQITGVVPPATDTTTVVKAFEPGNGFDVGDYCLNRAVHVTIKQIPGAEVLGTVREA